MIFLIEGCGQNNLAKNWGDGLATDPAIVSSYGIDSAAGLFSQLLTRSYVNQVRPVPARSMLRVCVDIACQCVLDKPGGPLACCDVRHACVGDIATLMHCAVQCCWAAVGTSKLPVQQH